MYDALYELFGADKIDKIGSGEIEVPLAFMRGRTLKIVFILDETQNATETQIKVFLTQLVKIQNWLLMEIRLK